MLNYTEAQRAAIEERERSVIVIAGAGSGKTRVLVDRFVGLLADHPEWPVSALVAITFTEKAARELRERIRSTVEDRLTRSRSEAERSLWRDRAAELDSARIGTIHSLCATILRANAARLPLDPAFSVLDESQAALIRESAVEKALIELIDHPIGVRLFSAYTVRELRDLLERAFEWDSAQFPDPASIDPAALLADWEARYVTLAADQIARLWQNAEFAEACAWQPNLPIPPDNTDKLYLMWREVQVAIADLRAESDPQRLLRALANFPKITVQGGSDKIWGGQLADAKQILKSIRGTIDALNEAIGEPIGALDGQVAELVPAWHVAIGCLHTCYRDLKQAARALDFNDLERRTRDLLQDESIARRYRNTEFKHVMIDEFQDTNAAQRDILIGLTGYAPGSLFIVGDPKQAIYGFRGAEASVFDQVAATIRESGGLSIALNTSFRAHQAMVATQNDLFGALFPDLPTDQVFMHSLRLAEAHHVPAIEILALDKSVAPEKHDKVDSMRAIEARLLADRLIALIDDQLPIWDRAKSAYRPVTFGDCAVLCRSHRSIHAVESVFKLAAIPYVTVGGQGFFRQEEVQDLTALLQALYNPADELALVTALRSPIFALSDDALYGLRLLHPGQTFWAALISDRHTDQPDGEAVETARESLIALRTLVGRLSIADLLQRALDRTGFLAVLASLPDGVRRVGNVQKLIDRARQAGPISLGDFVAQLTDASERELREGEVPLEVGNAVRLMTIHASKGLEFPIVAVFDTGSDRTMPTAPLLWDYSADGAQDGIGLAFKRISDEDERDKQPLPFAYRIARQRVIAREQAESLRVWYVAVTRAADRLLISGSDSKPFAESRSWLGQTIHALMPLADMTPAHPPITHQAGTWTAQLHIPAELPLPLNVDPSIDSASIHPARKESGWDRIDRGAPIAVSPYQPPLSVALPAIRRSTPKAVSATSIAKLSQAIDHADPDRRARLLNKLRIELFHAAPDELPTHSTDFDDRRRRQLVGEVVHRALQFDLLHQDVAEGKVLETLGIYAWQLGRTEPGAAEDLALEAFDLLKQSDDRLADLIGDPVQIYRELPFSFQLGERTITGQIDALFFDGIKWTILDYKTDDVPADRIYGRARRYYGQLGVYAAAVEQLIGQPPRTVLYFIRPGESLIVKQDHWRAALDRLTADLDGLAAG